MPRFYYISIICLLLGFSAAKSQNMAPEDHLYSIKWKWGLVDLNAAHARVSTSCRNGHFFGTLTGESIPWEGRVYSVADTLQARLRSNAEHIQYVNGWYRKPRVKDPQRPSDPANYLTIQGQGRLDGSPKTMEAVAVTANMLSLFYYARSIDFGKMSPGEEITIPIKGRGATPVALRIRYDGADEKAYNVTFCYDFDDEPESYDVRCAIDAQSLLPLSFSSDIRIGHVSMNLVE